MSGIVKAGLIVAGAVVMVDLFRRADRVQAELAEVRRLARSIDVSAQVLEHEAKWSGRKLIEVGGNVELVLERQAP